MLKWTIKDGEWVKTSPPEQDWWYIVKKSEIGLRTIYTAGDVRARVMSQDKD